MKKYFLALIFTLLGFSSAAPSGSKLLDLIAPEFVLTNHLGQVVRLEDFRGKPVVLNFWASWCGPCRGEFPGLHTVWSRNKGQVEFLAVAISEPRETSLKFMQDNKYTFTVLTDPANSGNTEPTRAVANRYGIEAIPTTYFIDAGGVVRRTVLGGMNTVDFRDYLREIGVNDLGR